MLEVILKQFMTSHSITRPMDLASLQARETDSQISLVSASQVSFSHCVHISHFSFIVVVVVFL